MGSGLILLVIVGAWLAVLVPMALRSQDAGTALRSAERFGDAMRVLAPRSARRAAAPPEEPVEPLLHEARGLTPRPPLTLVERRRRVLLSLLGGAVAGLLGGLLTRWLLLLGVVLLVLAAAYVVHLRRLALAKAEASMRSAGRATWETGVVRPQAPSVPGVPDRMPARPRPRTLPAATWQEPAWQDERPLAVGEWSPVPVPPPVYTTKPVASRASRVLDLGEADGWQGSPDLELDDILEGRRAVGGW
ncbi:MAG: hypothetical protein JWM64_781 [Frankiales bacterium]|nr:hypothetical protein [Frankiales bacterium]